MSYGAEKIDPAHWVTVAGGAVMLAVLGLCSLALWAPWWTLDTQVPGRKENTQVSLWIRYTRIELAADDSTLNCDTQCDFTKIGSAKVREERLSWADVCSSASATEVQKSNCTKLWCVRIFMLIIWFNALLYGAFATLNFFGAGLPASFRIPAGTKVGLAFTCILFSVLALVVAFFMEIRLKPTPPGTEPPYLVGKPPEEIDKVPLNGPGFASVVAACLMSVAGMGVAWMSQVITIRLDQIADVERGRELADVNSGTPPDLSHQIGHVQDPLKRVDPEEQRRRILESRPPLGTWMVGR